MIRTLGMLRIAAALTLLAPLAPAEETQPAQELRELRSVIEQQAKQIEALTQQVAKLAQLIEATTPAPVAAAEPAPIHTEEPAAVKPEILGQRHIVVKGETLTSIAKQYNVPLTELAKANKDVNDRKLQIGQQLIIPKVPEAKTSDTTDKKEKP